MKSRYPRTRTFSRLLRHLAQGDTPKYFTARINHIALPELFGLYVPIALPGESPPIRDEYRRHYSPDSVPLTETGIALVAAVSAFTMDPANARQSNTFYRSGIPIRVRTRYIALDQGWQPGYPPLLWETFVLTGDAPGVAFTALYATRGAAHAGHVEVAETIREAQRQRRLAWREAYLIHSRPI